MIKIIAMHPESAGGAPVAFDNLGLPTTYGTSLDLLSLILVVDRCRICICMGDIMGQVTPSHDLLGCGAYGLTRRAFHWLALNSFFSAIRAEPSDNTFVARFTVTLNHSGEA